MTFHVGQKVVCIKLGSPSLMAKWASRGAVYPELNGIYTIRGVKPHSRKIAALLLKEISNAGILGLSVEPAFDADHFRPVVDRKTEVSFTVGADPETEQFDNRRKSPAKVGA